MSTAENIVQAIVDDLTGRRGLRQEWEQIDDDVRVEIFEEWTWIVKTILDNEGLTA